MRWDRRTFLRQSLLAASGFTMGGRRFAQGHPRSVAGDSLVERMTWLTNLPHGRVSAANCSFAAAPRPIFGGKTFYGNITDNGHFFRRSASGDFVFQARVNGNYAALYDQAGLMVRLDAENWIKCGTDR